LIKDLLFTQTYYDLYSYSVQQYPDFWEDVFKFSDILYTGKYTAVCRINFRVPKFKLTLLKIIDSSTPINKIPKWFAGIQINMAENILFGPGKEESKIAVTSIREGNAKVTHTSWGELRLIVGTLASALRANGTQKGDRVAVISSNNLHTLSVFLATVSIGAIFTSTSTDMGSKGILDRLCQIRPRLVFMEDFAVYGGKITDLRPKAIEVVGSLQKLREFEQLVIMPRFDLVTDLSNIPRR
jgi:acetoacetyl-CoA synthetase